MDFSHVNGPHLQTNGAVGVEQLLEAYNRGEEYEQEAEFVYREENKKSLTDFLISVEGKGLEDKAVRCILLQTAFGLLPQKRRETAKVNGAKVELPHEIGGKDVKFMLNALRNIVQQAPDSIYEEMSKKNLFPLFKPDDFTFRQGENDVFFTHSALFQFTGAPPLLVHHFSKQEGASPKDNKKFLYEIDKFGNFSGKKITSKFKASTRKLDEGKTSAAHYTFENVPKSITGKGSLAQMRETESYLAEINCYAMVALYVDGDFASSIGVRQNKQTQWFSAGMVAFEKKTSGTNSAFANNLDRRARFYTGGNTFYFSPMHTFISYHTVQRRLKKNITMSANRKDFNDYKLRASTFTVEECREQFDKLLQKESATSADKMAFLCRKVAGHATDSKIRPEEMEFVPASDKFDDTFRIHVETKIRNGKKYKKKPEICGKCKKKTYHLCCYQCGKGVPNDFFGICLRCNGRKDSEINVETYFEN